MLKEIQSWENVDFIPLNENQMEIALKSKGWDFLNDAFCDFNEDGYNQKGESLDYHDQFIFRDLIEDALCNGWSHVSPIMTGDLTDNPFMISDNLEIDDNGDLEDVQDCYYFDFHMTASITKDLFNNQKVVLQRHDYKE